MRTPLVFAIFTIFFITLLAPGLSAQILLSRGFDTLQLGMTFDEAEKALIASTYLMYRGAPDLSLRPGSQEPIVRVLGRGYVEEAYLQFLEDRLYSLIVVINPRTNDYLSFYQKFAGDYGRPYRLSPEFAEWEDGQTRIRLDKPLQVQYLDSEVFNRLGEQNRIEEAAGAFSRDLFMDSF